MKVFKKTRGWEKTDIEEAISEAQQRMGSSDVAGKDDITWQLEKVFDMLQEHHLKELDNLLGKLLHIKDVKLNAQGVQVQGQLDQHGQDMVRSLRKSMDIIAKNQGKELNDEGTLTSWGEHKQECADRIASSDPGVSSIARDEYNGILLAEQWYREVGSKDDDVVNLKKDIKEEQGKVYDFTRVAGSSGGRVRKNAIISTQAVRLKIPYRLVFVE